MDILRLIARLLDYPEQILIDHQDSLLEEIRVTPYLPPDLRRNIISDVKRAFSCDLYDLQSRYDALFDRGRQHSLLLFEHVHGESRDRGQAMVDLINMYSEAGFELNSHHLPDYLPLFLEFLSTREPQIAANWLAEVGHILRLLAERLRKNDAWEAILFDSLLLIAGQAPNDDRVTLQVHAEEDDRSFAALDQAWEDKEIRFDEPLHPDAGCATSRPESSPIRRAPPQATAANEYPIYWHKPNKSQKPEVSSWKN